MRVSLLLAVFGIFAGCSADSANRSATREPQVLYGLFISTANCAIPEGCGARFQLEGENSERITLEGAALQDDDNDRIVAVSGAFHDSTFDVSEVKRLTSVTFHDFLRDTSGDYVRRHYPCLVEIHEDGIVFTKWDKTFSWERKPDRIVERAKISDRSHSPSRFIELEYGGDGQLLSVRVSFTTDPCA